MDTTGRSHLPIAAWLLLVLVTAGCGQPSIPASSVAEFERATSLQVAVDTDGLKKASLASGPYKVVPDDVLELHMPLVLVDAGQMDPEKANPVLCRVGPDGTIGLPISGRLRVVGKTLADIEQEVIQAYYPKYLKRMPSVTARLFEGHTVKVRVLGAVKAPGVYSLRSDEMTLVCALMKAGGILPEGSGAIRVRRADKDSSQVLLPVRGLNVPFSDMELTGGEDIEVARANLHTVAVLGLVSKPGVFPVDPDGTYNLAQALAMGGGLDRMANPKLVKVCRQDSRGNLLTRPVRVEGENLAFAAAVPIRSGDVVVVENTVETDVRMVLLQVLRFAVSANASYQINQ